MPPADRPRSRKDKILDKLPIVLIVGGLAGFIFAFTLSSGGDEAANRDPAIEELFPAEGSEVLRQTQIGIDLQSGYDAQLYINDIPIPLDEVNIRRSDDDPGESLPSPDQVNSLSRFLYQPAPNKTIEVLPADRNCVLAEYWPLDDPANIKSVRWCFTVA